MKKKTCLCLLAALSLILGLLSGCAGGEQPEMAETPAPAAPAATDAPDAAGVQDAAGFPLCEEMMTFTYWLVTSSDQLNNPLAEDFSEVYLFQRMTEMTNVEMKFISPNEDTAAESLNILLASGDAPDVMAYFNMYYSGTLEGAIADELILDLADYVETYMPNYYRIISENEDVRRLVYNENGNLPGAYSIKDPAESTFTGPIIRQDLLEKYNLELPETYADVEEALTLFAVNGEGGLGLQSTGFFDVFDGSYSFSAGYEIGNTAEPFINQDGVAVFTPITQGWYDYLEMMADWNAKGLIYPDWASFSVVNMEQAVVEGDVAMFDGIYFFIENYEQVAEHAITLRGTYLPKRTEDQTLHLRQASDLVQVDRVTAINAACADLDILLSYLDYWYTEDGKNLKSYGEEGVSWEMGSDGRPHFTDYVINNPDYTFAEMTGYYRTMNQAGLNDWRGSLDYYTDHTLEALDIWVAGGEDYVFPASASMKEEDDARYTDIMRDITNYVSEYVVKVIHGDQDLASTWADYVETIEQMQIEEATACRQRALDSFLLR